MKNKQPSFCILLMILSIAYPINSFSQIQVGILTNTPENVFHIDAAGNNDIVPIITKYNDEIVVNNDGKMGIGTNTPTAKLHIKGSSNNNFKLETGNTPLNNAVMVSDADGVGTWQSSPPFNQNYKWRLSSSFWHTGAALKMTGSVTFSGNLVGAVNNPDYTLTIPSGKYLVLINGDINTEEYALFELRGNYKTNPQTTLTFVSFRYEHYLGGNSAYIEFPDTVVLSIYITLMSNRYASTFSYAIPYSGSTWYQLNLLKLE
ncbi:hypothetical protein CLV62_11245 [Dysgonomonas alginatilytica]|uniref:Uncharacterized protein n=1 Tax=Dysgonomonas alginatilytica TaxID=1605892 RepID=A0A2V3PQS9_9BACT|nr:hypothetical protein [Dysgonomonas alginatilytica]PXV63796.1 hypothetical protein CLV62_11245 [Dysgonomonas alginatilytica]